MRPVIVHVAQIEIGKRTGMGRVAWHWKTEFQRRGYEFIHIGPQEVGRVAHPSLFPYVAYKAFRKLRLGHPWFLVHEPSSGVFAKDRAPLVVFSHGVERRGWQLVLEGKHRETNGIKWRSRILYPLWRLRQCDAGLTKAAGLLLINTEDSEFVQRYYGRSERDIYVFRNGMYPSRLDQETQPRDGVRVLFLGSWLARKGINTLIEAAQILALRDVRINWLLAGTGAESSVVLGAWPDALRTSVEVVPHFAANEEEDLLARSNLFVLPSSFEGQPLSLLQAMETGRCCITTDCCGQRDLIQHGINGLLHQPGDAQQLAFLIEQCAKDQALREELGRNAKQSVRDRSWEAVASEVVNWIEQRRVE